MHTITLTTEQLQELHVVLQLRTFLLNEEMRTKHSDIAAIASRQFYRTVGITKLVEAELCATTDQLTT